MTIASEIEKLQENLADSYTSVSNKGGTLPESENFDNLPDAIDSIPASSEPVIESLSITPSTSSQTITASGGTDGYSPISVSAVTNSIDANITAGNIVSGVSILGVTGTATELNGDTLSVTPSTSAQVITPTSPKNGFTQVNVSAVTSSIDANIQAGNIKKDVEILGVTGTFAGGGEYNGLGTKYYKTADLVPYFEIPSGAFEDYTVNYESSTGALGITGYDYVTGKDRNGIYYNGILNWFCNITDDGIATGWDRRDSTNYKTIFLKDALPSSISQLKIIIKAKMVTAQNGHAVLFATSDSPERYIGIRSSTNFAMYSSGWTTGSTTITKDVWYWYCVTFDGTTNTAYILQDNNYTLDTLPELSQWSQEWTNTANIWTNNKFIFGVNPFSTSEALNSSSEVDLSNTFIEINNETFYSWELASPAATIATGILKDTLSDTSSATDYNLYYNGSYYELDTGTQENHFGGVVEVPAHTVEIPWRPEFTINGWLNYESGMGFTNFSSDRYIEADYKLSITTDQWTSGVVISVHFKTPARDDYYSGSRMILSSDCSGLYNINGFFDINMTSTSISFRMTNDITTIFNMTKYGLTPNTEYWARLVNPTSGDTYLEISTDGINWETATSASVTFKNYAAQRNMKVGVSAATTPAYPVFDGVIYAGDTYIEIGGVKVWNMAATIVPVPPV